MHPDTNVLPLAAMLLFCAKDVSCQRGSKLDSAIGGIPNNVWTVHNVDCAQQQAEGQ